MNARLYLIGMALQGILAADRRTDRKNGEGREPRHVAAEAVEYADATLIHMGADVIAPNPGDEAVLAGGQR